MTVSPRRIELLKCFLDSPDCELYQNQLESHFDKKVTPDRIQAIISAAVKDKMVYEIGEKRFRITSFGKETHARYVLNSLGKRPQHKWKKRKCELCGLNKNEIGTKFWYDKGNFISKSAPTCIIIH